MSQTINLYDQFAQQLEALNNELYHGQGLWDLDKRVTLLKAKSELLLAYAMMLEVQG